MTPTIMNQDHTQVDMSKIIALQQKRTLAFVNHFVMTNVQFLNNFMKNCEQKLMTFERKLEKINASMVLLETRLSSIPEVNIIQQSTESKEITTAVESTNKPQVVTKEVESSEDKVDTTDSVHLQEYDRFVKMVQVGVPLQAVKNKATLEGLDPDILDKILEK